MVDRPPHLYQLIHDEDWLKTFCTYKQQRALLHWAHDHPDEKPVKIENEEGDEKQSFITIHFENGAKITF